MNYVKQITIPELIKILQELENSPNKKDILIDNQYITYSYTPIEKLRGNQDRSFSFIDLFYNINYTDI
jgi:hypothetical protein